jgi:DNA-binding MarR family transcriptional regulator/catechol 2,3-dioxygenase-like lactoylglutathione lyase family enzyme
VSQINPIPANDLKLRVEGAAIMSTRPNLPIGYWLKEADRVITEAVNRVQAIHNISRTEWQILNTLYEVGSINPADLGDIMRPFVDAAGLDAIIAGLAERGWVAQSGGGEQLALRLTDAGRQGHAAVQAQQKVVRRRAIEGISEEEYATVIQVLQRMVSNLGESAPAGPLSAPPRSTPDPNQPVKELRVALTTGDYGRLMRFYGQGLGLEPAQLWVNDQDRAVIYDLGKATLEIFDEPHAQAVDEIEAGRRSSGPIRFALQVPDLQTALDRLLAQGAILVHPPVVTPWGHHNVRLQDPDGMQITLFQILDQAGPGNSQP